MIEMDLY